MVTLSIWIRTGWSNETPVEHLGVRRMKANKETMANQPGAIHHHEENVNRPVPVKASFKSALNDVPPL